jgi:hypothetical protein
MDLSALTSLATSIKVASDLGKAALGVRDFNEYAAAIAKVNDQLLKAQDGLLQISIQTHSLVQQLADAEKKALKLQEAADERARYTLIELSEGIFVHRLKGPDELNHIGAHSPAEPTHYLCQRCFASGTKSVLMRHVMWGSVSHHCPTCKNEYFEKQLPSG